ncbi:hypothetical protein [Pseudomonas sp. BF-R-19]|uniref:hypothetical protein n=1 Tax=Pseudomonas sp. BF-R-19 TaxID=2832397 RepID=UPI001CBCB555|nr:hypothetical protein [Pseudomonas sp. BF-R-19]
MLHKYSFIAGLVLVALSTFAEPIYAKDVHVRAYTRSDGTHVQAHYRSAPDGNFDNNWSTLGNVNPYTGEPGTLTSQRTDTAKAVAADTYEDDGESDPDYDL